MVQPRAGYRRSTEQRPHLLLIDRQDGQITHVRLSACSVRLNAAIVGRRRTYTERVKPSLYKRKTPLDVSGACAVVSIVERLGVAAL